MNCCFHPEREASAYCVKCGKGLCNDCAEKYSPPLCSSCANGSTAIKDDVISHFKHNIIGGVIGLLIGIIPILLNTFIFGALARMGAGNEFGGMSLGTVFAATIPFTLCCLYIGAALPSGWKSLWKIKSSYFLVVPIAGIILYYAIKGDIAMIVGVVAFPVDVYKYIKSKKENSSGQNQTNSKT
ncbi:MAG: B-box zinc finger protein [Oscillospiraceae bacterium]|nr:B-box zinc finger protein [Oscillospiraceae bacterium]